MSIYLSDHFLSLGFVADLKALAVRCSNSRSSRLDGPDRKVFLGRFTVLMALSILLATLGVAEDSPPVVIGAMLISPLTTPLMGVCASLVLGWPKRLLQSANRFTLYPSHERSVGIDHRNVIEATLEGE